MLLGFAFRRLTMTATSGNGRASIVAMLLVASWISMCRQASRQTSNNSGRNESIDGSVKYDGWLANATGLFRYISRIDRSAPAIRAVSNRSATGSSPSRLSVWGLQRQQNRQGRRHDPTHPKHPPKHPLINHG